MRIMERMTRALRILALTTLGLAALTARLGVAVGATNTATIAVLFAAPALAAWRSPHPLRFAVWTGWAWLLWLVLCGCTLPEAPVDAPTAVVAAGAALVGWLATCGAPIAMWLSLAARRPLACDGRLESRMRAVVRVAVALAAALAVVAFLPGVRVHAASGDVTIASAGGMPVAIWLAILVAPGALVYRDPGETTLVWSLWALPASVVGFALTDRTWMHRSDLLWAARFLDGGVGTLIALILVISPMVWLFTHGDGPPEARAALVTDSSRSATDSARSR